MGGKRKGVAMGGGRVSLVCWAGLSGLSGLSYIPLGSRGSAGSACLWLDEGPEPINLAAQADCAGGALVQPIINLASNRTYFYTSSHYSPKTRPERKARKHGLITAVDPW